jgi:NodT family efflux transporter outer membrane factor (OMF) lipoprotein
MRLKSVLRNCLWLLLPLFAGCSLHRPQEATLPVAIPPVYVEPGATAAPPVERWWESFADPRLNALVEESFAANLDLAQAFARIQQAEAQIGIARAGQLPSVNLDGAAGRGRQPGFKGPETADSFQLSAAAAFELDLWGKLAARTETALLEADASREDAKTLYLSLSARVADLYFLAVEQRAQLELADRSIAAFTDTLERVERRYREGLVPALDVYQSRQNLAGAQASRPLFANTLAATEHALAVLLGRYPEGGTAGTLAELPIGPAAFPAGLPADLLARRPDIEAALLRLKASDARIAAAIADRFPSFNLIGNFGGASSDLGELLRSGNIFWSLLLDLAQPVFDGGRRSAEVERNRALFRENLSRYHQSVLTAFQEVEDALAANRTTEERIVFVEARVTASQAALRLALDRYLQGLSDYLPVLTAQGLQFDAESQLLAARRQLLADRISLARALGGKWMAAEMGENL